MRKYRRILLVWVSLAMAGSERQLAELEEHFDRYAGHYLDHVRLYEQQRLDQVPGGAH